MSNVFKRDIESYHRMGDPVETYIKHASYTLSKKNGLSIAENANLVKQALKKSNMVNPEITFLETDDNGDKHERKDTLREYIEHIRKDDIVAVPSFTTYVHPSVKKSVHANFLDTNIALRKQDKHDAFKFKQLGDDEKYMYYNTLQKTRKIFNNSLSGAYASKSTILYSPSAHYSLTSTTRVVASIGNAITESIVAGNKQYMSPEVTYNFIVTVMYETNKDVIDAVDKYNLYIPTVDEVIQVIRRSSDIYWYDSDKFDKIRELLTNATKYELANVVYNNNLWDMKNFNSDIVRDLISGMVNTTLVNLDNPLKFLKESDPGLINLAHHILVEELSGLELNYDKLDKDIVIKIASVIYNCEVTLNKYANLIKAFFVTDVLPPTMSHIKDMLRDCIVLSDTDSTCGSYDQWGLWYFGTVRFDNAAVGVSAAIMTINTQVMDHYIKRFAGTMNVDKGHMDVLAMKNEFFWNVFTSTNVSKHYFANIKIQEGNVFKEPDLELKGVHLIASKSNEQIRSFGLKMINKIQDTIIAGEKISLREMGVAVADMERSIINSIKNGDINIYDMEKIKEEDAYKLEAAKSPYLHHMLWEEVFSGKYGPSNQPQYMVLKIPTTLDRKNRLIKYLDSIEDVEIREKLTNFLTKFNKESLGTFRVPLTIAAGDAGIPKEILQIVDMKRVVLTSLNMLYIILTSIGLYRKEDLLLSEIGY